MLFKICYILKFQRFSVKSTVKPDDSNTIHCKFFASQFVAGKFFAGKFVAGKFFAGNFFAGKFFSW